MSSLIVSHDSHLMMLEIAVDNLFVPWTTAFDKIILKKTIVMFRMLDKDWISLSPNRHDYRPYQGSNYENEKFYGGRSVVFSVPTDFFGKEASDVNVQLYVRKQVCKDFEMVSRQRIGFAAVPVDNLLNSISKQIRERNELAEHLSDFYKRQIISRSMMGTYTLSDENFRNTAATISLYIRISYLGQCFITEITQVKSIRGAFYTRGDLDEKQPYFSRQLTSKELQSGRWVDTDLPRVPYGRLICRCEELVKKEAADLAKIAVDKAAIKKRKALARKVADSAIISAPKVVDAVAIKGEEIPDDTVAEDVAAIKEKELAAADSIAISVTKIDSAIIERREARADYGALDDADVEELAKEKTMISIMATDDEVIDDERAKIRRKDLIDSLIKDVKADAAATAKMKGLAIKENGERIFKEALGKSKCTTTIGITERRKRILPPPSLSFSCLQTYPLCCQLQPHLTCFTDCFDVSPCYCYWTACPLQFFYDA